MSKIIEEVHLIMTDAKTNHNKFWRGYLMDDGSIETRYGRVGYDERTDILTVRGKSAFDTKIREKERKGYKPLKTLPTGTTVTASTSNLHEVAKKQIVQNGDQIVLKLVDRLVKENVHTITTATNITFNTANNTFQTPLGLVTLDAISEARGLLNKITDHVDNRDYDGEAFLRLVSDYLSLIPQNTGMKIKAQTLFGNTDLLIKQSDILDSLESSLNVSSTTKIEETEKVFNITLEVVSKEILEKISKKFKRTVQHMHPSSHYEAINAYKVRMTDMEKAFEKSKKLDNILELWHGTKTANLLSILKCGLRTTPPSTAHITGKMFGNGIYFSDQSTKALNYSVGTWSSSRHDTNPFMLLCDVAMGKMYTPNYSTGSVPRGYDSMFAKAGVSGVVNNEMIVYKENQVNPTFLVEFKKKK